METLKKQLMEAVKIEDSIKRRIAVVSILTEALKSYQVVPVIVGGFAVELWTMGKYTTLDIDLIADGIRDNAAVLYDLGFKNNGAVWTYPQSDIIIEFPKPPLEGDYSKLQPLEFNDYIVNLLGIEDIILDRVSAAKHWKDLNSREWAVYLSAAHYEKIDWDYCEKKAVEKLIEDELTVIRADARDLKSRET